MAHRAFHIAVPRWESTWTDALAKAHEDSDHPEVRCPGQPAASEPLGPGRALGNEEGVALQERESEHTILISHQSLDWRGLLPHTAFVSEFTEVILCESLTALMSNKWQVVWSVSPADARRPGLVSILMAHIKAGVGKTKAEADSHLRQLFGVSLWSLLPHRKSGQCLCCRVAVEMKRIKGCLGQCLVPHTC